MLKGFRARLIVFSILAVAPLFGVRFWEIWQERSEAIAEAKEQVVSLTRRAAKQQANLIEDTHALLDVVKGVPGLQNVRTARCETLIRSFRDARPWIENLSVADATGTIGCSTNPNGIGINIADRRYYELAWTTSEFKVSDLVISRGTHRPTVVTALPFVLADGQRLTFLATLKLSWLEELFAEVAADLNGDVYLIDLSGNIIASHQRKGAGAIPADLGEQLNDIASGASGRAELRANGNDTILVGYAGIPDTTARVFVGAPHESIIGPAREQTLTALRDLGISFVLIVIVALISGEILLLRPIHRLNLATRRIADGDYRTRADVDLGPAEFRNLGKTFNVMVDRLEALVDMDPMTGLANRRQLDRHLQELWNRSPTVPLAIAMIDVDHFKRYNDFFGHVHGDKCLQAIAHVVKTHGRRAEDLAARFGGEEFTLVIPGMTREEMAAHCEGLREAVELLAMPQPDSVGGVVTVSVGVVSVMPIRCPDIEVAIKRADRALYAAKAGGRNRISVDDEDPRIRLIEKTGSA